MSCAQGNGRSRSRPQVQWLECRRLLSSGDLDTTFGAGGIQLTQFFGSTSEVGARHVIQPDGKIVVAGSGSVGAGHLGWVMARYNADGSLDPTFGTGGTGRIPIGTDDQAWGLALQPDGKIVVAGATGATDASGTFFSDFGVVRLNPDGSLDTTFNGTGVQRVDFGGNLDHAYAVALQPDGRIVVAGNTSVPPSGATANIALARLNPDGSLDSTFGAGGKVVTDASPTGSESAQAIMLDSAGRIVISGTSANHFLVARYNPDGSLDHGFAATGFVVTPMTATTTSDTSFGVAAAPGGKIVACGYASNTGTLQDMAVARYNSDGSLDPTFGSGGKKFLDIGHQYDKAYGVAVLGDGRVVLAGVSSPSAFGSPMATALVRLTASGSLDTTFNGTGAAVSIAGGELYTPSLGADGSITAAGAIENPGGRFSDVMVARYLTDGTLDPSLGGAGFVSTDFSGPVVARATGVALQQDGKAVAVGWAAIGRGGNVDFALARYNIDGSLDTSFGDGGLVSTDFGGINDRAAAVAVQSDGNIVVVGDAGDPSTGGFGIARYLPDGELDQSFGTGGELTVSGFATGIGQQATAVAIQPDSSIVVAGTGFNAGTGGTGTGFLLARITPWGALDTSFNGTGKVYTSVPSGTALTASAVAIDPAGRILVGGSYTLPFASADQFAVARYDSSGALDTTFGGTGLVKTAFTASADLSGLDVTGDGSVVAAGTSGGDFALARYLADGTLDSSFGTGGKVTTDMGGSDSIGAVRVLPDGSVLAAGGNGHSIALAHYTASGALDPAFGSGGKVTTSVGTGTAAAAGMALRPDGGIVVAGTDFPGASQPTEMVVAQYVGIPPLRVSASQFNYQSSPPSLQFTFSEDISQSLGQNTIEVTDRTTGQTTDPLTETYDPATRTATFTFDSVLPSGRYQATLRGDSFYDAAQVSLDGDADGRAGGDYVYNFFYLTADVNHDASVNFTDLLTLAQHYGQSNATFAQGDVNYDGTVSFSDLLLLAQNYGRSLEATAATGAVQPAAASALDPFATIDSRLRSLKRTRAADLHRIL